LATKFLFKLIAWPCFKTMLAAKDHRHVFSTRRYAYSLAKYSSVTQYLGCVAQLFIWF